MMIDHGSLPSSDWRLDDLPRGNIHATRCLADRQMGRFEPWLTRILHFPDSAVDRALSGIPSSWLEPGEEQLLEQLMLELLRRRSRVPDLIEACRNARPDFFPNWHPSPYVPLAASRTS